MEFYIPIKPFGQARPRSTVMARKKFPLVIHKPADLFRCVGARVYKDPEALKKEKELLTLLLPYAPKKPLEGPVSLIINAVFQRPLSHYGSGRNSDKLKPSAPMDYLQKPDGTNVSKAVEDVMNGIFWKDDTQVTAICFRSWAEPGYQEGLYISLANRLFDGCTLETFKP